MFLKFPERRALIVLALASALVLGIYLAVSAWTFRIGFPLDDSWIHQTYARNLALRGEWSFIPGKPSGGSTSPLWSALLALGYLIGLGPYIWTFFLGSVLLWGIGVIAEMLARRALPKYTPRWPWAGLLLVGEWHLIWASASGMETLLHGLFILLTLGLLMTGWRNYLGFGLIIGVSLWVRPDGLTLLAPVGLVAVLADGTWLEKTKSLLKLLAGFTPFIAIYLLFNLLLTGNPFPNTFYAKQAEYAVLLARPLWLRLAEQFSLPLIGVGAILLPGVIGLAVYATRQRYWGTLAGFWWFVGYLGLYALRLPVTYQHGRYIMPAMPIYYLWGVIGLIMWAKSTYWPRYRWIVDVAWLATLVFVSLGFVAIGGKAYAQDVAVIESEMVDTAQWVAANVPPGILVAAHDIGALGYFGQHDLIDLAGLISPEVIPFIRDDARLAAYLDTRGAGVLVAFPDWYPALAQGQTVLYSTQGQFALQFGEKNMAVYTWRARP